MHSEDSIGTFKTALAEVGCPLSAVRKLVCTHHHPDHFGTSRTYKELTGAEVYLNPLEIPVSSGCNLRRPCPKPWHSFAAMACQRPTHRMGNLRRDVISAPCTRQYYRIIRSTMVRPFASATANSSWCGRRDTPPGTAVSTSLRTKYWSLATIVAEDHSSCRRVSFWPGQPLRDFLDSQQKVQQFDVELVLPAHGRCSNHRHRAQQIIQHHKYRLQEMHDTITGHARTAYEVAMKSSISGRIDPTFSCWRRPLRPWPTSTC